MGPAVHEIDGVGEDRSDERAGAEPGRVLAPGEEKDEAAPHGAGGRAGEDRPWADLVPREPAEGLAETVERLVEGGRHRLVAHVARGDPGPAAEEDRVDLASRGLVADQALETRGVIGDDPMPNHVA